jgi:hypothetical protein
MEAGQEPHEGSPIRAARGPSGGTEPSCGNGPRSEASKANGGHGRYGDNSDGHGHRGDGHAPFGEVTSDHDCQNPSGQKIGNYGTSATATMTPAGGY